MEDPPKEGGEQKDRKIVKQVIGWLALQALAALVRHWIESSL